LAQKLPRSQFDGRGPMYEMIAIGAAQSGGVALNVVDGIRATAFLELSWNCARMDHESTLPSDYCAVCNGS
jgi:hypothetical protein